MKRMEENQRTVHDLVIGAYLAEFDMSYQEIAAVTDLSTAEVGRALTRLRRRNLLTMHVEFPSKEIETEVLRRMRHKELEEEVLREFGQETLKEVWVVHSVG